VSAKKSEPAGSSGHYLDVEKWKRREHFELYRRFAHPFFSVTVELDVTELWRRTRAPGGPSFFLAGIFCALRAANAVEAFRARVRVDRVWIHDQVSIGPTVLRADQTFAFARLEPAETFGEFVTRSEPVIRDACEIGPLVATYATDDVIYQTTLPWLRFTSFSNAIEGAEDSVPRVAFGKCSEDGGRWKLPVSVEVHHAVVDGLDVARFLEELQREIRDLFVRTDGR
jgi:chloramphenicol O-acetyltransferase type A